MAANVPQWESLSATENCLAKDYKPPRWRLVASDWLMPGYKGSARWLQFGTTLKGYLALELSLGWTTASLWVSLSHLSSSLFLIGVSPKSAPQSTFCR